MTAVESIDLQRAAKEHLGLESMTFSAGHDGFSDPSMLLEADCKTVEEMRLANALCRLVELAGGAPERDAPRGT